MYKDTFNSFDPNLIRSSLLSPESANFKDIVDQHDFRIHLYIQKRQGRVLPQKDHGVYFDVDKGNERLA